MAIVPEVSNAYEFVKNQVPYTTGWHPIECPQCRKAARAYVSGFKKNNSTHRRYRFVKTSCRHCRGQVTFCW